MSNNLKIKSIADFFFRAERTQKRLKNSSDALVREKLITYASQIGQSILALIKEGI